MSQNCWFVCVCVCVCASVCEVLCETFFRHQSILWHEVTNQHVMAMQGGKNALF